LADNGFHIEDYVGQTIREHQRVLTRTQRRWQNAVRSRTASEKGTDLNHPPLLVDMAKSPGGTTILIRFSAYERLVLEKNHDHELTVTLDQAGNVKTSRLVRY
jgi:hypothetical protein